MSTEDEIKTRWTTLGGQLNERQRRLFAANEAKIFGWGGIEVVHRVTGLSRPTIRSGIAEINQGLINATSTIIRNFGGGRKSVEVTMPGIENALKDLVEDTTRGDPESPLKWCCKSLRSLTVEMRNLGFSISHFVVRRLLKQLGYSLQANVKVLEGSSHPDRNAQFEYINELVKVAFDANQPVISVDAKKKELVGSYANKGENWEKKGQPQEVNVHDFVDPDLGRVAPYGVYDIGANEAWVGVGTDNDTAQFAVNTIERWWNNLGIKRYPEAKELVITADGGGSNGSRVGLWKQELARFAKASNLIIHVRHFPPGTSKWNKIEHRLFSFMSMNWRGRPLVSHEVIVNLIANTKSSAGLKVFAELDLDKYQKGIKVTKTDLKKIKIETEDFHPEWNYSIHPS